MRWYQRILAVIAGALLAGSPVAQQCGLALRTEPLAPTPAFDGNLPKLAAVSPMQPVSLKVDFAPDTSTEALAELIFAERAALAEHGCPD